MRTVALGSVAETIMGQAPPGAECNKEGRGTVFVKAGEFDGRFPLVREWTTNPLKIAKSDDVLVCVVGATAGKVSQSIDCSIGRSVAAVRPRQELLRTDYLYNFLVTQTKTLRAKSQGLAQGVITREMLEATPVPLPPLDEQRRIAAILDQADDLRRKRRDVLKKADRLSSALFTEMFVEGRAGKTLNVKRLEEICSIIRDGTHKTPTYVETGVPFVTVKNIVSGTLDLRDTKFISPEEHRDLTRRVAPQRGDILVSKDGTIGIPCPILTDQDFSIFVSVALLRPKPELVDQSFLTVQLRTSAIQKQIKERSKGIAIRHLHLEDFRALGVVVPDLDIQHAFAAHVAEIDSLKAHHLAHLAKLDALFASLQHRAFRGEL